MTKLHAYTGNKGFANRNAAWADEAEVQRFYVNTDGWADVAVASIAALEAIGLVAETDFRPGGTAKTRLQVRWAPEVLAKFGYDFPGYPTKISGKTGIDPVAFLKAAASR